MARRSAQLRLLAVLACGAAVLGTCVVGTPAADAGSSLGIISTTLENTTRVTSTTGHHLKLYLFASQAPGDTPEVKLSLTDRNADEQHIWSFGLPPNALMINGRGAGTVTATSSQMGGYGKLAITIKTDGPKHVTATCGGEPVTARRPVTLTGKLLVITKSSGPHKWGSAGSATKKFPFSANGVVTWNYNTSSGCGGGRLACTATLSWQAFVELGRGGGYEGFAGGKQGKHYVLDGTRYHPLPHTQGIVTRTDQIFGTSDPLAPTFGSDGSVLMKVRAGPGGSGWATIVGQADMGSSNPCGKSGQMLVQKDWSGSWTNGAHPMKLHAQIFGALSAPDNLNAAIDRARVRPAP
jgi:hypothetical protein